MMTQQTDVPTTLTIDHLMHRFASLTCVALTSVERSVNDLTVGTVANSAHHVRLERALDALGQMADLVEAYRVQVGRG